MCRGLTVDQREAELMRKRSARIAEGLTLYKDKHKYTLQELANELGVSVNLARKLLNKEPTQISIDRYWLILRAAGLRITEMREDVWS